MLNGNGIHIFWQLIRSTRLKRFLLVLSRTWHVCGTHVLRESRRTNRHVERAPKAAGQELHGGRRPSLSFAPRTAPTMGNTPSRGPDASVPSNRDKAVERLRELRHEYGNGINANILVENAIGEGYVVSLTGESSECGRWHQLLQSHVGFGEFAVGSHCKRDAAGYGLGVGLLFRVVPADRNIEQVVLFGVGIDVPHGTHKLSGVAAVANVDQSSDLVKLVENARSTHSSVSSVVACNIECLVKIETDDVFLPTHPKIVITFKKFKEDEKPTTSVESSAAA